MTVFSERPWPSLARDGTPLPEGWTEVSLEEIVVHALGGEWGKGGEAPGLVPVRVVRSTEFREWARDKGATAAQRWIKRPSLDKRRLWAGDIVVEISGGGPGQPVGRTLLIDDEALRRAGQPLICSNFCRQIRIHPAINPAFVQLALLDNYLQGEVEAYQTQTTNLRNLKFRDFLAGTLLRLPPPAEQKRLVEAVEDLFARLASMQDGLARLQPFARKLRKSVLAAAVTGKLTEEWRAQRRDLEPFAVALERRLGQRRTDYETACRNAQMLGMRKPKKPLHLEPGAWSAPEPLADPEVPAGWNLVSLQDVINDLQYGTSKRAEQEIEDGVPVLRMGNIQDGELDTAATNMKKIDARTKGISAFVLRRGDILFNRTNSPELVGKAAVFDRE